MATDANDDAISYVVRWTVNGKTITGARTTRLAPDRYKPEDTVQVHITPADAYTRGRPMLSQPLRTAP